MLHHFAAFVHVGGSNFAPMLSGCCITILVPFSLSLFLFSPWSCVASSFRWYQSLLGGGKSAPVATQDRCLRSQVWCYSFVCTFQLSLGGMLHHHFQQLRTHGHQVCCTIYSRIFDLGGSNIAPMFSGPTPSDVLQFSSWRCVASPFCSRSVSSGFRLVAEMKRVLLCCVLVNCSLEPPFASSNGHGRLWPNRLWPNRF